MHQNHEYGTIKVETISDPFLHLFISTKGQEEHLQ